METLTRLEFNGKWKQIKCKKSKKRLKTAELPFAHIKENIKLYKFITTKIKI